ncbi:MAG: hypothetical protein A2722_02355 [Candidatus Doudnabacteria bacterium RIFCSPHIGHO2_01_FULL_50_11]|uniref:Large ribosomal subunit protein bL25 n=1 Tax=Candidatus Doudnabacteria bacterium RIFCSPHIGHO2_01_FULL_50_11 TaxID=1817828 RepID=A0A1F5PFQ7_9BACT|nr:MAG: hypothetical protein A2722_02355 [Candidatus Doudnabacteria bacterium RIFCSPHIGHO2_01_FULL_50_11]HLC45104.1 50S ribosomal protein L25 [Patescibacteria group bacterium]
MAQKLTLAATPRGETGKQVDKLRGQGLVPAVVYGHRVPTTLLTVDRKEFEALYHKSGGSTLIELAIAGEKPKTVLVHDVQHHYITDLPSHVDFYQVNMSEKIKAKVPLVFQGESKAVKDLGGVLIKSTSEIEVEALPADLPHAIEVDVSKLNTFEDVIIFGDLPIDHEKVKTFGKPEEIMAKVVPPRSEEELKALEEKPVEEVAAVEGVVKETPEAVEGEEKPEKQKAEKSAKPEEK